jgi:hypothetical protein
MMRRLFLGLLLALPAIAAHADIYACAGQHGMTVYQNFPCQFRSLGSLPAVDALQGKSSSSALAAAHSDTGAARNASTHAASGKPLIQARTAGAGEPGPGASEDDVRKAWGEPEEIIQDEPPSGRVDIWRYKDGRSVQIGRGHRVVSVQL